MKEKTLDKVLKKKVEPLLDKSMHKILGVTISEFGKDISDKIERNPLISYNIDTSLDFKTAKKMFKKQFLKKMLQIHLGNVSEVAKVVGLDRRSIHRAINRLDIDIDKIRKDMIKAEYYKKEAVEDILKDTLDSYKSVLQESKLEDMYKNVDKLSSDIAHALPTVDMSWKEAEKNFEKEYLKKALKENKGNVSKTARQIGIRYETLHRKLKKLGLK